MKNYNLKIIMGLPGSGKTTMAQKIREKKENTGKPCCVINLDNYMGDSFEKIISKKMSQYEYTEDFVIEGLLLTNNAVSNLINAFKEYVSSKDVLDITIHYFEENREACLHNDIGRRERDASTTIRHAKFEVPDKVFIREKTGVDCKIQKHKVVRKSEFDIFMDVNGLYRNNMLCSDSWSRGGTYGTCWGNGLHIIKAEEPLSFKEFDELMEKVCPNVSFLQYKKLERECCSIEEKHIGDYYGGCETRAYHKCDLKKLFHMLTEMGYVDIEKIKEEELEKGEER